MSKWKLLLAGILAGLTISFFAGCRTSDKEWTGAMSNQNGSHVQPFNPQDEAHDKEAIRLVGPLSGVSAGLFAAARQGSNSDKQPGSASGR